LGCTRRWWNFLLCGLGGYATGEINLTAGDTLYIVVGQQGFQSGTSTAYNGGGSGDRAPTTYGDGFTGGGTTHIATATGTLASLSGNKSSVLIVGGGGGGAGGSTNSGWNIYKTNGGYGGGTTGGNGSSYSTRVGGTGGSQISGGVTDSEVPRVAASFGLGGSVRDTTTNHIAGGGGGGGYYGGGAGKELGSAGGGGSSYIGGVSNGSTTANSRTGAGYATITADGNESFTGGTQTGSFTISGNIDVATLETASQSFDITIGQSGASAIGSNTTFNNTGVLTLGSSAVGQSLTVAGTLTASTQSTINIGGSISSTSTMSLDAITLTANTTLTSTVMQYQQVLLMEVIFNYYCRCCTIFNECYW
jgi:hypothetical protein